MKLAKASEEDMDAMFAVCRIFNAVDSGTYPPLPDGEWMDHDPDHFDETDPSHWEQFYHRMMACVTARPGCWNRVIFGFHVALTNDVFDPAHDVLEWHPTLAAAVSARTRIPAGEVPFFTNHTPPVR